MVMEWWSLLREWANEHSGVITLFSLVLTLLFAIFIGAGMRAGIPTPGDILKDRASWPQQAQKWRRGWSQAYFDAIAEVLHFAEAFYGPKPLSFRAFNRCLTLAILYPVLAVLLGWVVANAYDPGGLALFPDEPRILVRIGKATALIGTWGISFWIVKNVEKFSGFVVDCFLGPVDTAAAQTNFFRKPVRVGFAVLFFTVTFIGALAVAAAFAITGAFAFAGLLTFAVAFAGTVAFFVALAIATTSGVGSQEAAALILLLYLALPILNAVADWLSIAITRRFLAPLAEAATDAAKRPSLPLILMRSAFDLVLALICLAGLLAAIVLALAVWDRVSPGTLPFTWQAYWAEIASDPLRGIPLYLMIATTLLPTVVHLIAGFGAMFTYRQQALEREADILDQKLETGAALTEIERGDMVRRVRRAGAKGFCLSAFGSLVLIYVILWPVWQIAF